MSQSFDNASSKEPEQANNQIIVTCAADDNFALPLAVTIRSALANLNPEKTIRLFVLDGGLSQRNKSRLLSSWPSGRITVEWVSPDVSLLTGMTVTGHVNILTYFRVLIPSLLPEQIHKVIYLDSDLVVVGDLEVLWKANLAGMHLLAVQDMTAPFIRSEAVLENYEACRPYLSAPTPLENYQELGIPPETKYFNGGAMVIDLDKWRQDGIASEIINYLQTNKDTIKFWDQDGLNAVLYNKWGELDHRWNQIPHIYRYPSWQKSPFPQETYQRIISDPWIIHFAARSKPWHADCTHPAVDQFFYYLDMTDWVGWRPNQPQLQSFYDLHVKPVLVPKDQELMISVVMSNYNGGAFIAEAIESVLRQNFENFEFVIVDDGSTDHSRDIITDFQQRYPDKIKPIYQANQGQAAGFNIGIAASKGEIICFLDSDDLWFPHKLENVYRVFATHHGFAFHQHNLFIMRDGQITQQKFKDILITGDYFRHVQKSKDLPLFVPTSGLSFHRHVLEKVLPIPGGFKNSADGYLTRTSFCHGEVLATSSCWGVYRVHHQNNTFENTEFNMSNFLDNLLIPSLNQYYEQSRINLRYPSKLEERKPEDLSAKKEVKTEAEFIASSPAKSNINKSLREQYHHLVLLSVRLHLRNLRIKVIIPLRKLFNNH